MGKKKKKSGPPPGPKGAPEWVVTFTDMVSLLVTFFVLMMTFSSLREDELLKLPTWLKAFAGVHEMGGNSAVSPEVDQVTALDMERGKPQPHSRPSDQLSDDLSGVGKAAAEDDHAIDMNDVSDGLLLEFGEDECFEPGSVRLPPKLVRSLRKLAGVSRHYPHMIVVEGFTDDAFRPSTKYPTVEALSLGRALEAVKVLEAGGVNPLQIQLAALGARDPRAPNGTAEGRRLNRRIEVRVLAMTNSRTQALERLRLESKL